MCLKAKITVLKACVITEGKGLQVPRLAFFSIKEIYLL